MTDEQSPPLVPRTTHRLRDQRPQSPNRPSKLAKIDGGDLSGGVEEEEEQRESIGSVMSSNPKLQRYLIAIEYIGTRFSGAQKQPTGRTVVGVLEDAFQRFIGQPVSVFCSSRTDAGVHALSNVCHVDVERISKRKPGEVLPPHEPSVVKRAVNHFLQKTEGDLMVIDVRCVPSNYHARYKAQERTYFYRILSGKGPLSAFEKDRAWHIQEELDLLAMQKACQVLIGRHDFSSFRAAACEAKSPIRTLEELTVTEVVSSPYFPSLLEREQSNRAAVDAASVSDKSDADSVPCIVMPCNNPVGDLSGESIQGFGIKERHRCFVVTTRARSFLYHQVRLLVGVLKSVGTGDLSVPDVDRILKAKDVRAASPMAPACGLYLGHVKYDLPPNM
ncbi:Pseudouridine synthase family protein [Striga hermonthica]|uniref:tRNA pseudouridine synthase n=1 Tax=Striga hermonthica TaxID=68872 RepID=A0A9N7RTN3_STRHE|nr:Pseudouridine synthase family protein [Striga hermonthica]